MKKKEQSNWRWQERVQEDQRGEQGLEICVETRKWQESLDLCSCLSGSRTSVSSGGGSSRAPLNSAVLTSRVPSSLSDGGRQGWPESLGAAQPVRTDGSLEFCFVLCLTFWWCVFISTWGFLLKFWLLKNSHCFQSVRVGIKSCSPGLSFDLGLVT